MRGLGQVAAGSLGAGLRAVGLGQAESTYGADPWGSGGTYAGRRLRGLGQATDDGTVAPPSGTNAPTNNDLPSMMSQGLANTLSQVTTGMAVMAALGTGVSGAASGGLVGGIAGGKGQRMKYAGRGALAGAAIANVGATVMGGIAWAAAGSVAMPTGTNVDAVKSGAMTFTLANAALAVVEIGAIVLTKAAR